MELIEQGDVTPKETAELLPLVDSADLLGQSDTHSLRGQPQRP
jgi:hypothetical protein